MIDEMKLNPEHKIENTFSEEELDNISGLCSVLQRIRTRLISKGYSIDELRKQLIDKKTMI